MRDFNAWSTPRDRKNESGVLTIETFKILSGKCDIQRACSLTLTTYVAYAEII